MYYVYVIKRWKNGRWQKYIGFSSQLKQRIEKHRSKYKCKLLYYEAFNDEQKAREREQKLKYYGSAWKELKKRIKGAG